jgi:hypothetical protein
MQGHRRHDVGGGQQLAAGARQPAPESGCRVRAVGMLESENQAAARLVVAEHGAGPREGRRVAQAGAAAQALPTVAQAGSNSNGRPQHSHSGGASQAILAQHNAHTVPGASTTALQPRQSGGRTASTTSDSPRLAIAHALA